MSTYIKDAEAARAFFEEHSRQVVYGPDGTIFIPQGSSRTRQTTWRMVTDTSALETVYGASRIAQHAHTTLTPRDVAALVPSPYWVPGSTMPDPSIIGLAEAASIAAKTHVLTCEPHEAVAFCRGERVEYLDDIETLRQLSPETFERGIQAALRREGVDAGAGAYKIDYFDDECDNIITYEDIDNWLHRKPVSGHDASTDVELTHDGFVRYMTEVVEDANWYFDTSWQMEMQLAKTMVEELQVAYEVTGILPAYLMFDEDALQEQLVDRVVRERIFIDPDIEGIIKRHGDVCVDFLIMNGDEWNSDYSNVRTLADAQADPSDVFDWALADALANNGLSWYAQAQGFDQNVMLTAKDEDEAGHEFYRELESTGTYGSPVMAVFASVSLPEWIECVEAKEQGRPVLLTGSNLYAGLVDPWNGAGGELGLTCDGNLVIPAENLLSPAIDWSRGYGPRGPYNDRALVSKEVFGYTVQGIYGTDETLYRSASINAAEQVRKLGLDPATFGVGAEPIQPTTAKRVRR